MARYVALLRGINVGGKNLIRMTELAACFAEHGFGAVATYIQSGNVLFAAPERSASALARRLEEMLATSFNYRASVVLRNERQLRQVVEQAPEGFGSRPAQERYDVLLRVPRSAFVRLRGARMRQDSRMSSLPLRPSIACRRASTMG